MQGFKFSKDKIKLLGITITRDQSVSEEYNFRPRLKAMETILKQWSRRKLSLKGKITVINALAISLIVYPTTVLDTPANILHEINSILYTFLWDGKRPKIAAKVMENSIKLGGLKMPNIFLKVKAWQLSRLTRAIKSPESSWVCVVDEIMRKANLIDTIRGHPDKRDKFLQCVPQFYRNILCTLYDLKEKVGINQPFDQSIWLNKNITIGNETIFWNEWYEKGITLVRDVIDENGIFYDVNSLSELYLSSNFLSVLQLRQPIPMHWRTQLYNAPLPPLHDQPQFKLTPSSQAIALTKLKSRQIYWALINMHNNSANTAPKCITKWNALYGRVAFDWEKIFCLPYKICRSTRLQSFQYRILHRTITCNHWLFNAKIKDNPNCETRNCDDTLEHFFVSYNEVKDFWSALNRWWNRRYSVLATTYSITDTDIIFGILSSEKYVLNLNFILVLAKKYIHDCKMTSQNITFLSFLVLLRQELSFEEQICIKNQREQDFIEKWFWLYDQL